MARASISIRNSGLNRAATATALLAGGAAVSTYWSRTIPQTQFRPGRGYGFLATPQ